MGQQLFRGEVLEARQAQWLGTIRIARPLSFTVATAISIAIAIAVTAFAYWGEFTRKATVRGVLLPTGGLIHVSAHQPGVIAEVFVREGDSVVAGQPLARLANARMTASGDAGVATAQALESRRLSLSTERRLTEQSLLQRQDAITQRIQSLLAEERQALSELETTHLRVQLSRQTVERQRELAKSGFVAAAQVQVKEEELLDIQLRERNAERSLQGLSRELRAARAEKQASDTQVQTALSQLDRALAALDQEVAENNARNTSILLAPQAGQISALLLNSGQTIQAGQTVASLVPSKADGTPNELQAELFAPSRTAGFIQIGQTVYMRYAAFPFQKFGMARGEIVAVSQSPIAAQDLPFGQAQALISANQGNESLYRIKVRLQSQAITTYGRQTSLTAGMSLDADVYQEKRRIWEWLLEPVLAATKKVGT